MDNSVALSEQIRLNAQKQKEHGRQVVVVQGLGYVGSAVAAVVANALDSAGNPLYYVIGFDLPNPDGLSKINLVNQGRAPLISPDPEYDRMIHTAVEDLHSLAATSDESLYGLADIIVVTVPLSVHDRQVESPDEIELELSSFVAAIRTFGRWIMPGTLVMVETTVPIGACRHIIMPALREELAKRQVEGSILLAHAYERVMPGPNYMHSIRHFWRTFSGFDAQSAEKARAFLASFIDTEHYPLWQLDNLESSEMAKLMENSYRALNIAFMEEWTLLAEKIGVDLFSVVNSIKVRKGTHDNMRYPGFGVGGYCLPKDTLLAQWSARRIFQTDVVLDMTLNALKVNNEMPLHTFDLLVALAGGDLHGKTILICGVSYLRDLADTRSSPTEVLLDALHKAGAEVILQDPYVSEWIERPEVKVYQDFAFPHGPIDGIALVVPHQVYQEQVPQFIAGLPRPLPFIVDGNNVLTDELARKLHQEGCRLVGVGKGHWHMRG